MSDAEKLRREEALVENERIVMETNERFLAERSIGMIGSMRSPTFLQRPLYQR